MIASHKLSDLPMLCHYAPLSKGPRFESPKPHSPDTTPEAVVFQMYSLHVDLWVESEFDEEAPNVI